MIQENIKRPLADELLFGKLAKGGEVKVTVKDGKLAFDLTPKSPKGPKSKEPRRLTKRDPKVPALVE